MVGRRYNTRSQMVERAEPTVLIESINYDLNPACRRRRSRSRPQYQFPCPSRSPRRGSMSPCRTLHSVECTNNSTSGELCPATMGRMDKYFKICKVIFVLILLSSFFSYIFDHTYYAFRREINILRGHIDVVDSCMANAICQKNAVDQQLKELAASIPAIKDMADEMKNNIQKCSKTSSKEKAMKEVVREEIALYNADKTGKTDFALESSGGQVLSIRNTKSFNAGPSLSIFGIPLCPTSNSPSSLIQPGVMPGECWAFKGCKGSAIIKLVARIFITGVSLEHIPRSISPTGDINTAPREFSIWGLKCASDTDGFFFGQFKYDTSGTPVQYYPVKHRSSRGFDIIEFRVHSNYGHPDYTCIYRLRVHGDLQEKY